jgi:hypothetical protein
MKTSRIDLLSASHTTHFPMTSKAHPYTVITPDTTLEDLEAFFNNQGVEFALGEFPRLKLSVDMCQ